MLVARANPRNNAMSETVFIRFFVGKRNEKDFFLNFLIEKSTANQEIITKVHKPIKQLKKSD